MLDLRTSQYSRCPVSYNVQDDDLDFANLRVERLQGITHIFRLVIVCMKISMEI